ncbi:MAG: divergent polysaccharide deacetylase family protein [Elusimicrobia bacterium]|nr:divergent polysaccharide deacetylase family protein [Elusimicrobiota bacterium]
MKKGSFALLLLASVAGPALGAPKPRVAVVIDDFGLTYKRNVPDEKWYALEWPVTFAVMPESPRTREAARRVKEAGHELIIHFPFDPFLSLALPKDRLDPADLGKVEALLEKAFSQIPGPVGLNNHRSYRATQNRPLMTAFMERLKPRNVYFLDSGVSPRSVAYAEARAAGIPAARNYIFLEEPKRYSKEFCAQMLRRAAARARRQGSAIAIGHHYYQGTYDGLVEEVPRLRAAGIEFVRASALLER